MEYLIQRTTDEDELYHHGVKGMKWGVRKKYQSAARSLGGSHFAKNAVKNSRYLDSKGKKQALDQQAYLAAKKKSKKTGGQITYDVSKGKYTVSKNSNAKSDKTKINKGKIYAKNMLISTAAGSISGRLIADLATGGGMVMKSNLQKGQIIGASAGALVSIGVTFVNDYMKSH